MDCKTPDCREDIFCEIKKKMPTRTFWYIIGPLIFAVFGYLIGLTVTITRAAEGREVQQIQIQVTEIKKATESIDKSVEEFKKAIGKYIDKHEASDDDIKKRLRDVERNQR